MRDIKATIHTAHRDAWRLQQLMETRWRTDTTACFISKRYSNAAEAINSWLFPINLNCKAAQPPLHSPHAPSWLYVLRLLDCCFVYYIKNDLWLTGDSCSTDHRPLASNCLYCLSSCCVWTKLHGLSSAISYSHLSSTTLQFGQKNKAT